MREIWRKTAELFWERPILWVPVLCADFVGYWLMWLERLASRQVVIWMAFNQSPLNGALVRNGSSETSLLLKVMSIAGPLLWGTYFLNICLYTLALVTTSVLLEMVFAGSKADLLLALRSTRLRLKRVGVFSLKMLLFFAGGVVIFGFTVGKFALGLARLQAVVYGAIAFGYAIVAYFMAPGALLLLRDSRSALMRRESGVWARKFAIAGAITISAIAYLGTLANESITPLPIFAHGAPSLALSIATSFSGAFAYILLFIALSLIGRSDAVEAETVVVGSESGSVSFTTEDAEFTEKSNHMPS